jgi:hypothetical protein
MDAELYRQEVWSEIKQTSMNLCYLEHYRDTKAKIEPLYRGFVAVCAVLAAITVFFEVSWLAKVATVTTAILTAAPHFAPFLPDSARLSEIGAARLALKNRLNGREIFWRNGFTEEQYDRYMLAKREYAATDGAVSVLFGKIDRRMHARALEKSEKYLLRFTCAPP